ncbi:phage terminase large subunit family protein [Teichococcus vastitatis]|uniref:Terminase large subunit gp17-like C-terminal domain-containing protein n=1 Tax=Teichococcus vastitatis TaxID=2307076 RepID=A0ABS9WD55_9PROT|nr:hypothetical protein [Pseudoroseomonas vastitatis]MCI0756690.1 hypothetical protein [Pseudoroseomonas vastitatis]
MNEAALKALRKRFYTDFKFYAEKAPLKIKTKKGETTTLTLKPAQLRLIDLIEELLRTKGRASVIILKARQQGMSTATGGYLYYKVSQNKSKKAIVVTHKSEASTNLFDMTKRFHDGINNHPMMPLKPSTSHRNGRQLAFDKLDSGYAVATAGGDGIGRGDTFFYAHLSELAFWPAATAEDNFNGLMQAISPADGTVRIIESTANGVGNIFYREWQKAVNGESDFVALFIPWFEEAEYREPVTAKLTYTDDEKKLKRLNKLDDEQLMFRRMKIAEIGPDAFKQEYPSTAEEAFLTSGTPVFPPSHLEQQTAKEAKATYSIDSTGLHENSRGALAVWQEPKPGETYYVSGDVASGSTAKGKDWSVSHVLDSDGNLVARYRAQIQPDVFAHHLEKIALHYNEAKVIVENNNHGGTVLNELYKHIGYKNVFTEVVVNKITEEQTVKLGFNTNKKTKPQLIDRLKKALREREINIPDKITLAELKSFVEKPDGGMGAEGRNHDDCVMSLALALWIHERRWEPITNQEDWYVEGL